MTVQNSQHIEETYPGNTWSPKSYQMVFDTFKKTLQATGLLRSAPETFTCMPEIPIMSEALWDCVLFTHGLIFKSS